MRPGLTNDSGLKEYIKNSSNIELQEKFKYLENNKEQVILFFEYTEDKNSDIIEILQKESFYKSILKKEFQGVAAYTPVDFLAPVIRLIELAYNDFKEYKFELKEDYN